MNLHDIWRALQSLCKVATQTLVPDDSGDRQIAQMKFLGQTQDVKQVVPYGLVSSSPINSEWLIFSRRANPDDKVGIANDYKGRFKGTPTTNLFNSGIGLKEGESCLYNQLTGSYIFLDEGKNINIIGKNDLNVTIDANENVSIGGNSIVAISGNSTVTIAGNSESTIEGTSGEIVKGDETRTLEAKQTVDVTGAVSNTYQDTLDETITGNETKTNIADVTEVTLGKRTETTIGTVTIIAPTTNHTGNINLIGNYNIVGELTVNDIIFSTHVHGGVQAGSSDTEQPDNPEP